MADRKRTMAVNIMMLAATLLAIISSTLGTGRAESRFQSQGRIIFDNKTEEATDDVVFDSEDLDRLAGTCR